MSFNRSLTLSTCNARFLATSFETAEFKPALCRACVTLRTLHLLHWTVFSAGRAKLSCLVINYYCLFKKGAQTENVVTQQPITMHIHVE